MITALIILATNEPDKPYLFLTFQPHACGDTYYWSATPVHDPTHAKTPHDNTLIYWLQHVTFEYKIIAAFSDNFQTPTDFTELLI